jgi:hypothetical protein
VRREKVAEASEKGERGACEGLNEGDECLPELFSHFLRPCSERLSPISCSVLRIHKAEWLVHFVFEPFTKKAERS